MRRLILALALGLSLAACASSPSSTAPPAAASPTVAPTAPAATPAPTPVPTTAATPGPSFTDSIRFGPDETAALDFLGGTYGIGWTDCLWVEVRPFEGEYEALTVTDTNAATSGEVVLDIPAGKAWVNRVGEACMVTLSR